MIHEIVADWKANKKNWKGRLTLFLFRVTHASYRLSKTFFPALLFLIPLVICYKLITEVLLGIEISFKTSIGAPLTLHHGIATVVNMNAKIGSGCILRHSTTIGVSRAGGGCPVIGDNVDIGAGAIILGDIQIGDRSRIGAGSVVTKSVSAGNTVVGNPAKILERALSD